MELVPLVPGSTVAPWSYVGKGGVAVVEPEAVATEAEAFWTRAREDHARRKDELLLRSRGGARVRGGARASA